MKFKVAVLCTIFCASTLPAQDLTLRRLNTSPRHSEWVQIPSGGRTIHGFVSYPEKSENTGAVIVIHENRGLTEWVRSFTDQLAEAGYLAIAPDFLSDFNADHHRTEDFKNPDEARDALYKLNPDQVDRDMLAVQDYIAKAPSSNGKTAVIGFCWGGGQAFRFASKGSETSAVLVFYGTPPDKKQIRKISSPVYGFYGGNDQRIGATIPETEKLMKKYKKPYEYETYEGAGHAFMRAAEEPGATAENQKARDASWIRIKRILSEVK